MLPRSQILWTEGLMPEETSKCIFLPEANVDFSGQRPEAQEAGWEHHVLGPATQPRPVCRVTSWIPSNAVPMSLTAYTL